MARPLSPACHLSRTGLVALLSTICSCQWLLLDAHSLDISQQTVTVDKRDPFRGYEGTYEGQCIHYAYLSDAATGRYECTDSPVTYPAKWIIKHNGPQYTVTSIVDKTTIEHEGQTFTVPSQELDDVSMAYVYSDMWGHCVHMSAGKVFGELRVRVSRQGDDFVLQEDGHWHLNPTSDGELVRCPPRSAYVPLFCSPDKNMFGYKCTYYKRKQQEGV